MQKDSIIKTLPVKVVFFIKRYIPEAEQTMLCSNYDALLQALYDFIDIEGISIGGKLNAIGKVAEDIYDMVWRIKYIPKDDEYEKIDNYIKYLEKLKKYYLAENKGKAVKAPSPFIFYEKPKNSFMLRTYKFALVQNGLADSVESEETYEDKQVKRVERLNKVNKHNEIAINHNLELERKCAAKYGMTLEKYYKAMGLKIPEGFESLDKD